MSVMDNHPFLIVTNLVRKGVLPASQVRMIVASGADCSLSLILSPVLGTTAIEEAATSETLKNTEFVTYVSEVV